MNNKQKIAIFFVLCTMFYVLFATGKYWLADYNYNIGKSKNLTNETDAAIGFLLTAIKYSPNQPLYHAEIATSLANKALAFAGQKDMDNTKKYADGAINEIQKAISLAPNNVNLKRSQFGVFIRLSPLSQQFMTMAKATLVEAVKEAPTDAKLYYNLGLIYARTGELDKALETLKKTIELKSNYTDAKSAYDILLAETKQK